MAQGRQMGDWLLMAGISVLVSGVSGAAAATVEYRDFAIAVDGKPAGDYHLTITAQDNGTHVVTGKANVTVRVKLVYTYTYAYSGTEVWQGRRLLRLDSTCTDDGKSFAVTAAAEANGLRVRVNRQERMSRPDVWTTTYWQLPEVRFRNGAVPLLDADTGRPIDGRMQYLGTTQLQIGGKLLNCPHYCVIGDKVHVDLWYDDQERMVRQEGLEDGHRTVFELTGLRR
jgi:hypothetical protein